MLAATKTTTSKPNNNNNMQTFTRDVRRMLRHSRTRVLLTDDDCSSLSRLTHMTARYFVLRGNNPRFMMAKLLRIVEITLKSLKNGTAYMTYKGLKRFTALILHTNKLLMGSFGGCFSQNECCCSVCLVHGRGQTWKSSLCGHRFHVKCISTHFFGYDTRCPLCRVEHGFD